MTHFLKETKDKLKENGMDPWDIVFIGSSDGQYGCTWDEFTKLADVRYDSGYGGSEIPEDLVIVFKDGSWLERGEYDGAEWWEYKQTPSVPEIYVKIETFTEGEMYTSRGRYLMPESNE